MAGQRTGSSVHVQSQIIVFAGLDGDWAVFSVSQLRALPISQCCEVALPCPAGLHMEPHPPTASQYGISMPQQPVTPLAACLRTSFTAPPDPHWQHAAASTPARGGCCGPAGSAHSASPGSQSAQRRAGHVPCGLCGGNGWPHVCLSAPLPHVLPGHRLWRYGAAGQDRCVALPQQECFRTTYQAQDGHQAYTKLALHQH